MFTASNGEGNQYYGMRHSHRMMVHNVMAWDNNNNIVFFLVEGRGFHAPGLDRVQLAYLIDHFDIRDAVSLDGGFSANVTIQMPEEEHPRYLMTDPEKRDLGVSFTFAW
jgi:exopolysaccharide biosynthesis protein